MNDRHKMAALTVLDVGQQLAERGWLRATSGNLSVMDRDTGIIYITKSGIDKQLLVASDIIGVNLEGTVIEGDGTPSFETAIHIAIYRATDAQCVLHVHTVFNNLITRHATDQGLILRDHEMLKALGHWDENATIRVPIVPNYADIAQLSRTVTEELDPQVPAILVQRHGIYAYGRTADDAQKHLEALEFLFEWLAWDRLTMVLQSTASPAPFENLI